MITENELEKIMKRYKELCQKEEIKIDKKMIKEDYRSLILTIKHQKQIIERDVDILLEEKQKIIELEKELHEKEKIIEKQNKSLNKNK